MTIIIVTGMIFIWSWLELMEAAIILGCCSVSFLSLKRLFSILAFRISRLNSFCTCWVFAIFRGSVMIDLTTLLRVVIIRPAIISVVTGYLPPKSMYWNI